MLTLFESRYTLKRRYNIGNVGQTASMSMLTLFESRYTRVSILIEAVLPTLPMLYYPFNVYLDSKRVSILIEAVWPTLPMLYLLFNVYLDSKLKRRYNIGNVGRTASVSMLTLFESRYALKGRYNIGNVGKTASVSMLTLFESRYALTKHHMWTFQLPCIVHKRIMKITYIFCTDSNLEFVLFLNFELSFTSIFSYLLNFEQPIHLIIVLGFVHVFAQLRNKYSKRE